MFLAAILVERIGDSVYRQIEHIFNKYNVLFLMNFALTIQVKHK